MKKKGQIYHVTDHGHINITDKTVYLIIAKKMLALKEFGVLNKFSTVTICKREYAIIQDVLNVGYSFKIQTGGVYMNIKRATRSEQILGWIIFKCKRIINFLKF